MKRVERKSELLPDFNFVTYRGLSEKDYPIWHEFEFGEEFLFIHRLAMYDYGYFVDDAPEDDPEYELPKYTSGSGGYGEAGILKLELHTVDRFGCRALLRGSLSGSSIEMNMDVLCKSLSPDIAKATQSSDMRPRRSPKDGRSKKKGS
ncbi:hypothetical protein CN198_27030 [Sinorhizobium meliloti]|uniref:hypothetical protein n=1 Tax=Rhizobium meliloti TaxID=382 RepID=UPI000FDBAA62|nr:hypothetical protein [Sinorhizobium meliloti]RVH62713.1 hypothetical protein CN198_27030 [Sinorhizobium meliloti]RVK62853.1 hypothetical protein CN159_30300 [Sinorhizobium meliloti]